MNVKLPTEPHLGYLSLKRGCTGSSDSTLVKMPHCWKSRITAQLGLTVQTVMPPFEITFHGEISMMKLKTYQMVSSAAADDKHLV